MNWLPLKAEASLFLSSRARSFVTSFPISFMCSSTFSLFSRIRSSRVISRLHDAHVSNSDSPSSGFEEENCVLPHVGHKRVTERLYFSESTVNLRRLI